MAAPALLFDADGTLWDSRPWFADVLAGLSDLSAAGVLEQLMDGASVVTLARNSGVTDVRFRSACAREAHDLRLYPGVPKTLEKARQRGTLCAIVTNLSGWLVRPLLAAHGLDKFFPVVIHAGTVRPRKPHPAGLLRALAELGVAEPDGVYYVGDGETDARAARSACIRFAWASYGYEDDCPPAADAVLREFDEVLRL